MGEKLHQKFDELTAAIKAAEAKCDETQEAFYRANADFHRLAAERRAVWLKMITGDPKPTPDQRAQT